MKTTARPKFTVIIPTLNEELYLPATLRSLGTQLLKPNNMVIVDGGSSDLTVKLAGRYAGCKVYVSKKGVGQQRNFGATRADTEWLVFLDADVQPKPQFFHQLFAEIKRRKLDMACPLYYTESHKWSYRAFFWLFSWLFWLTQSFLPAGGGPCIIIRKQVFDKSAGFKPIKFEDLEFINRTARTCRFGIVPIPICISDRRLQKEGLVSMSIKYALVSLLFVTGLLCSPLAQGITYSFGEYGKAKR